MNVLEVQGLSKRYPSFELKDVSFNVPKGAIMGFIGRNGAGKTTTLKSILGLVHADGGEVRFLGKNVRKDERFFKENIGVVLGGIDFYPKKKLHTITKVTSAFYPAWDFEKYRHYCKVFELDENKRVDELSSGMRVKYLIGFVWTWFSPLRAV
jgi:ABC-2 type transport system ATP-binding protein